MRWIRTARRGHNASTSATERLITETETFLSGDYADHLRRQRERVPAWARLNSLAHANLATIRLSKRSVGVKRVAALADWHEENWQRAEQVIAVELVELVKDEPDTLLRVQRRVLIPLELSFMKSEVAGGLSVSEFLDATLSALRSSIS